MRISRHGTGKRRRLTWAWGGFCVSAFGWLGCTPGGGGGGTALTVRVQGGLNRIACVGQNLTLTATASGGSSPWTFRWSQERGPDVLADATLRTSPSLTTGAFREPGEYSFRVMVTDALANVADEWVLVRVGPEGACSGGFEVVIDAPESIAFGQTARLSVFAASAGEVESQWDVLSGTADLTTTNGTSTSFTGASLGRVSIRVTAREVDTGRTATDIAAVDVTPAIRVQKLHLLRIGSTEDIAATFEPATAEARLDWTVVRGVADVQNSATTTVTVASDTPGTVTLRVSVTARASSGEAETVTGFEEVSVVVVEDLKPRVVIQTALGDLVFELDGEAAPMNSANFLRYVDEGFYNGVTIHRYSCERDFQTGECRLPFVIQGGGYVLGSRGLELKAPTYGPVVGEQNNGLSNTLHTVGMALMSNDPDTAMTEFFINLNNDNARLDGTFTVFARVVSGTEILEAISQMETQAASITGGRKELLVHPVVMTRVRRE